MKNIAIIFAVVVLASGCATMKTFPLSESAGINLNNKTVTYTVSEKPPFNAMTSLNVQFAVLGALIANKKGNKIINENHVKIQPRLLRAIM